MEEIKKNQKLIIVVAIVAVAFILFGCFAAGIAAFFTFSTSIEKSCTYNGVVYSEGEWFDADDGCNQCSCDDGMVACTEMACLDDPVPLEDPFKVSEPDDQGSQIPPSEPENILPVLPAACANWQSDNIGTMYAILKDPNWNVSIDSTGTDYIYLSLQGDISVVGWPNIGVTRGLYISATNLTDLETYLQSSYSPTSITTTTFGVGDYPGLLMRMDGCNSDEPTCTSQQWDTVEVYFIYDGLVWNISMTDVDATGAMDVYQCFLDNFELL